MLREPIREIRAIRGFSFSKHSAVHKFPFAETIFVQFEKFVFVKNVLGFVLREIRGFITLMFMNEARIIHKLMSY